jgi:hypothetical protein
LIFLPHGTAATGLPSETGRREPYGKAVRTRKSHYGKTEEKKMTTTNTTNPRIARLESAARSAQQSLEAAIADLVSREAEPGFIKAKALFEEGWRIGSHAVWGDFAGIASAKTPQHGFVLVNRYYPQDCGSVWGIEGEVRQDEVFRRIQELTEEEGYVFEDDPEFDQTRGTGGKDDYPWLHEILERL